ncbi:MAG: WG repeat-containing protein [Reichenbachiella sp.]|uniref:WG repeat-containing protein n=1 Tax=Reichenbachiella sp. TaxID=2184521 RepID=UPI003267127F
MKKTLFCLAVLYWFGSPWVTYAEKTKQALRALEKGDYEKVEEILTKSMEKDSINPATEYVWALLYSYEDYPGYHLDTAHLFIQNSCEHLKLQDEDHLDELDDADLYEYDIKNKKMAIDSMAFARATNLNEILAYEHFINNYTDAADYEQAVVLRNQLVFSDVETINTWEAYADFIASYPLATQVEKAKIQYDKLIYEEKTRSGELSDFENFLLEEPGTPYRHSIEKKIFEAYVGELKSDKIINFLQVYKNPVLANRALNILYHLEKFDFINFSKEYELPRNFKDSVVLFEKLNAEPLAICKKDSSYQFLDLEGQIFLNQSFDEINEGYRCGNVLSDLLEVSDDENTKLINRKGDIIFDGYSGEAIDLGNGLVGIKENGKYGIVHKSGFRLLSSEYDELQLLDNALLVFKKNDRYGVMQVTGEILIEPNYDQIELRGKFWIFEMNENIGVTNLESITQSKSTAFEMELPYEEVELVNDRYIIGFKGDTEELISHKLQVISPTSTKRINTRHETWVLELEEGYTTFDPDLGQLSSNVYQSVLQNTQWLGLTRNGKWFVYNKNIYDEPIIGVDSLKLLGEDLAIVFRGSSGMAIFPNKKVVEIVEDQYLKSIGPKIQTETHFLVIKKDGENILYKDGVEQFRIVCDEIGYISDSAFYIKKNGYYGAVGLGGQLIMRIRYNAISQAESGVAPVLYRGKFGAYNFRDKVLLRIDYQEKLKHYNSDLFIVNENGNYGILDRFNELRVEPMFEQIEYWSDSAFLGLRNGLWDIVNINQGTSSLQGVEYYEYIKNEEKEKILLVRKDEGYGVYHNSKGMIVPAVFHDVMNLGNSEKQLYFTETAVPEADIYVVVYYDSAGKKLFSEAYREEDYEELVCEN